MIEALNLKGLASGFLAKSFHDVAIESFSSYWRADTLVSKVESRIPRYTTQDYSSCGYRDGKKPLSVRTWTCSKCKATHDRDINAAIKHIGTCPCHCCRHEPRGCG
ncbi:MAG: zinc ribbon domain-containing protein [Deinococcales bacterium]